MTVQTLSLRVSVYVGEGLDQTCTVRDLTERDFTPTQLDALSHIIACAGRDPDAPSAKANPDRLRDATLGEMATKAHVAKQSGFTGEMCDTCGSFAVKRTGKCTTCSNCGATGGCG